MRLTSYSVSDMKRYISCAHIIIHWILRCQSLFKIKKKFLFFEQKRWFPFVQTNDLSLFYQNHLQNNVSYL